MTSPSRLSNSALLGGGEACEASVLAAVGACLFLATATAGGGLKGEERYVAKTSLFRLSFALRVLMSAKHKRHRGCLLFISESIICMVCS